MSLLFKKDATTVHTDDLWYDLTDGGYIDPDKLLEANDATRVKEAIELVQQFLDEAEYLGYLEIV